MSIKVIAFDVFGTVFDLSGMDRQEIKNYVDHIRKPEWSPLDLPCNWYRLPAHPDSAEGIRRLRSKYRVVTCSNGPLDLLSKISRRSKIEWDAIVPLEANQVFKTNPRAYLTACQVTCTEPSEVMMVTANIEFGDIEASTALGMTAQAIRAPGHPATIIELAEKLGC